MKKNFEQPALEVVRIRKNDIVTASGETLGVSNTLYNGTNILAPGQRGLFEPSDDWANAGY